MKKFLTALVKHLGSIIVLAGVAVLAIAQFSNSLQNTHLFIAGALFIIGILTEVFINKKVI